MGYIDDCIIIALNYITNYTYSGNVGTDQRVMLQMTLRTLGGTAFSQGCRQLAGYGRVITRLQAPRGEAPIGRRHATGRKRTMKQICNDEKDSCPAACVAPPDDRRSASRS